MRRSAGVGTTLLSGRARGASFRNVHSMVASVLSPSDIESFIQRGFVRVRGCFSREEALAATERACERLYCSLSEPSTWPIGRMRAPESRRSSFEEIAPRAWQAACELLGGAERVAQPCVWTDQFIINFGRQAELDWLPPCSTPHPWHNWHKDGDFFRHFLDSPEQGLLVIGIFSDIDERDGATYLACDSVGHVARHLAARPEGVLPADLRAPALDIISRCRDFIAATGEIGDVYLLHPFMLHSQSVNAGQRARFIVNPPVKLREPMRFDRGHDESHSPVERAVLAALGAERYEFVPTRPREAVVPERLARERREWDERARAGGSGAEPHLERSGDGAK
jgi:hypothetical protein